MIVANEYTFTQSMLDEGVDIEIIKNLRRKFKGWRIYFRGKGSEYDDIKSDYEEMLKVGYIKKDAIREISLYYDKSETRIKEIVRIQKGLFDEV